MRPFSLRLVGSLRRGRAEIGVRARLAVLVLIGSRVVWAAGGSTAGTQAQSPPRPPKTG
jgi:hypothetical protein